jgi:hypothetical protein
MAPVGASQRDRRRQCDVNVTRQTAVNLDRSKVFGLVRVRQAVNLRLPPERCQRRHAVMQGDTAAQDEVAAVGIGARKI